MSPLYNRMIPLPSSKAPWVHAAGFKGNSFPDAYSGTNAPNPNHHVFRQTGFSPGTCMPGSANEPSQSRPGKDIASALWTTRCVQHQVKSSSEIKPAFHIIKIISFGNTNTHASSALPVLFGIQITGVHCGLSVAWSEHGGFTQTSVAMPLAIPHQLAGPASLAFSRRRARNIRFFTMLIGILSRSAISSYCMPDS